MYWERDGLGPSYHALLFLQVDPFSKGPDSSFLMILLQFGLMQLAANIATVVRVRPSPME
jgi:hypothetical protein